MNGSLKKAIEAWEGEGGAVRGRPRATSMDGTVSQVEWALLIKRRVNDEFDRVGAAFRSIADRHMGHRRTRTEAIIGILEDKRAEVMGREQAGYFIHDWQEIGDQVRQMIFHDPRYQAIKNNTTNGG
jgi:hypothetical protein